MRFIRMLSMFLCLALVLTSVGCAESETGAASSASKSGSTVPSSQTALASSQEISSDAVSSETASLTPSQEEASSALEAVTYDPKTVRVVGNEGKWKLTGRTAVVKDDFVEDAMAFDHPTQGFLFNADCEGTVTLHLSLANKMHFLVRVDGEGHDVVIEQGGADVSLVMAEDLPRGRHSFEIYRCNELYHGLGTVNAVELNGALLPYEAPEKDLKMVFIGDSAAAGEGILSRPGDERTYVHSDATVAYAFLTGEALNADFYVMAQSGMNLDTDTNQSNSCYNTYEKVCRTRPELGDYDNTKEDVDVFVIGLGHNGWSKFSASEMKEQIEAFIKRVRADHPGAKIVWCYGTLTSNHGTSIGATVRNMAKTDSNLYYYQFQHPDSGTANNHPTDEANRQDALELAAFIRDNVL